MQFFTDDLIADPYPHYQRWRDDQPIWWEESSGQWVLTRNEDVQRVLRDHDCFSSAAMGAGNSPLPLLTDDPPRHTKLRGIVNKAFTTRMLRDLEPAIEEVARDLVGRFPDGELDVVEALTVPFPVIVISRMMGIPEERREDFKRWSDALTGILAGTSLEDRRSEILEMATFFQTLIPERRLTPGDDLLSAVARAEVDGQYLSDAEIVGFNMLLLIAGNETTTNLLGNMLNVLATRPDVWMELRNNPDLIEPAIEETFRFDSPVQFLMRQATEEVEFHNQPVKQGERVMVVMGSANRDSRVIDSPDEFDIGRDKTRHYSLGYGIHFCLGAPLARLEARIAMGVLLERFDLLDPGLVAGKRVPSHLLRGFERLPLRFNRAR
ncbi:MAG: cytochrome P450 [Gammaproteobacteria bacterium]|nr:cytochrome P450 [Gammaproteobacteria bacterium]